MEPRNLPRLPQPFCVPLTSLSQTLAFFSTPPCPTISLFTSADDLVSYFPEKLEAFR